MAAYNEIEAQIILDIHNGEIDKIKNEYDKKVYENLNINRLLRFSGAMGQLELLKYFRNLGATDLAETVDPAILNKRGDVVLYLLKEINTIDSMPRDVFLTEHTTQLIKLIEEYKFIPEFLNCLPTLIEKHPNRGLDNIPENIIIKLLESGFNFEKIPNSNKYRNIINERRLCVKQQLSSHLLNDIIQIVNSLHQI
jgi:hypothetical protein